jgi:site-specific DNA recombinase
MQVRAVIYTRQSLDKDGSGDAVAHQLEACERLCAARDWEVVARESDNSISAFSGKPRPGYDRVVGMLADGTATVAVGWAVDRFTRSVTDLEALISLCERTGATIATVNGDLDLTTDQGRLVARILGSVARGESERKASRQRLANEQRAARGEPRKACPRPFGWQADRITLEPAEAEAIREAARALLTGGTLSGICRDWAARGVHPVQSAKRGGRGQWTRTSVKAIMLSPRLAAMATYKGGRIETEAAWQPILAVEQWHAVRSVLMAPGRSRAPVVRTMLGGYALCACGNGIIAGTNSLGQPSYRCDPATRDGRPRAPRERAGRSAW